MVNVNVVGGYDGVTDPPGMTNQSTTSTLNIGAALESYGGGTLGITSTPAGNSYLAWSAIPEDAISTTTNHGNTATSYAWLTRVVASTGGSCGHLDIVTSASTPATMTGLAFGIYSGASFATGPLGFTGNVQATVTTANTLYSLTWNGTSSPTPNLVAGQTYWIYSTVTFSSTGTLTLAAVAGANAAVMNSNLTASASFANNTMTLSPAPVLYSALTTNSTLTPQTSWANSANKFWYGLRA